MQTTPPPQKKVFSQLIQMAFKYGVLLSLYGCHLGLQVFITWDRQCHLAIIILAEVILKLQSTIIL